MSSQAIEEELVPQTDILLAECPKIRFLVLGKSGVGKSALINRVFGIDVTEVASNASGRHDINAELTSPLNNRLILHDSQGFEGGETANLQTVLDFIERRSKEPLLKNQLHGIWLCAEIPYAGARLFEVGDEEFLTKNDSKVPVTIVFTKLDLLKTAQQVALESSAEVDALSDEDFSSAVDAAVEEAFQELCVVPLRDLTSKSRVEYIHAAVSVHPSFQNTIQALQEKSLEQASDKVWLTWATAQRVSAKDSIEASIRVGRAKYWRGLLSDIFIGFPMKKCLEVLRKDIVATWNMTDPKELLLTPAFFERLTVLVADLATDHGSRQTNYPYTRRAINTAISQPSAIVVAAPVAVVVGLAEWVYQVFRKSKQSLRCLMGFIVDLTLTMDVLFWRTPQGSAEPLTKKAINKALTIYNNRKKMVVHNDIRRWVNGQGALDNLNPEHAITKIAGLIEAFRDKPEDRVVEEPVDEDWLDLDSLRTE